MRYNPEHHLITRGDRERRADLRRIRAGRIDESAEVQLFDQAIDALAAKLGMDLVFFAGLAELLPFAPKLEVKRTAQDEANSLFNPAQRRGG